MKLEDKFKQEWKAWEGRQIDFNFEHRNRIYEAPIWSLHYGAYSLISWPKNDPKKRTTILLKP